MHAIQAVALADLDGRAQLLQAAVERGKVQNRLGAEVNDHFPILARLDGLGGIGQGQLAERLDRHQWPVERESIGRPQHAFQDEEQAFPAGVDHSGLLEHRQEIWRPFDRFVGRPHGRFQHFQPGPRPLFQSLSCRLGNVLRHRQDRSFDRAHDTLVGGITGYGQSRHKPGGVHVDAFIQRAGEAAPQLREDHARIAPGAHQGAVGHGVGDLAHRSVGHVLDLSPGRLHRQCHIGAGVAVGNGKHVQGVDNLGIGPQPVQTRLG